MDEGLKYSSIGERCEAAFARRDVFRAAGIGAGVAAAALMPTAVKASVTQSSQSRTGLLETDPADVAETRQGRVRGYRRNGVRIFKGIPYADVTSGSARFMPPRPPKTWAGVRPSMAYGATSPQIIGDRRTDGPSFLLQWDDGYQGEDCLSLNIWSPLDAQPGSLPVMFWCHGGGFTGGSSHELPGYDGENMARNHRVVMVTVNHRLGPVGFLDLSEIGGEAFRESGNVGMLDLVAALRWVNANISAFGGDPRSVTIFGQSGGGGKVSTLMGMPAAAGLFHKAIIQSGSMSLPPDNTGSRALAKAVIQEMGVGTDLRALQELAIDDFIRSAQAAQSKVMAAMRARTPGTSIRAFGWSPTVDGVILPESPFLKAAPDISAHVPMIVGSMRDEISVIAPEATREQAIASIALPMARREQIYKLFEREWTNASPMRLATIINAMGARNNALRQVDMKSRQGTPAYNYWFTWPAPVLDQRYGAFHNEDLAFCFDNVALWDTITGNRPAAHAIGKAMSSAWAAFARDGDPSTKDLKWTKYNEKTVPTMVYDDPVRLQSDPYGTARKAVQDAALNT